MNQKGVEKWLILTIIGGLAFLGCQAIEWTHLITHTHEVLVDGVIQHWGTTTSHNPWGPHVMFEGRMVATPGPVAFGGYFFGITGFHGCTLKRKWVFSKDVDIMKWWKKQVFTGTL